MDLIKDDEGVLFEEISAVDESLEEDTVSYKDNAIVRRDT